MQCSVAFRVFVSGAFAVCVCVWGGGGMLIPPIFQPKEFQPTSCSDFQLLQIKASQYFFADFPAVPPPPAGYVCACG